MHDGHHATDLGLQRADLWAGSPQALDKALHAFGIPTNLAVSASSPTEALVVAQTIGFTVAIKIDSPDIRDKSDVNGVRLHVGSAEAVRRTYQN